MPDNRNPLESVALGLGVAGLGVASVYARRRLTRPQVFEMDLSALVRPRRIRRLNPLDPVPMAVPFPRDIPEPPTPIEMVLPSSTLRTTRLDQTVSADPALRGLTRARAATVVETNPLSIPPRPPELVPAPRVTLFPGEDFSLFVEDAADPLPTFDLDLGAAANPLLQIGEEGVLPIRTTYGPLERTVEYEAFQRSLGAERMEDFRALEAEFLDYDVNWRKIPGTYGPSMTNFERVQSPRNFRLQLPIAPPDLPPPPVYYPPLYGDRLPLPPGPGGPLPRSAPALLPNDNPLSRPGRIGGEGVRFTPNQDLPPLPPGPLPPGGPARRITQVQPRWALPDARNSFGRFVPAAPDPRIRLYEEVVLGLGRGPGQTVGFTRYGGSPIPGVRAGGWLWRQQQATILAASEYAPVAAFAPRLGIASKEKMIAAIRDFLADNSRFDRRAFFNAVSRFIGADAGLAYDDKTLRSLLNNLRYRAPVVRMLDLAPLPGYTPPAAQLFVPRLGYSPPLISAGSTLISAPSLRLPTRTTILTPAQEIPVAAFAGPGRVVRRVSYPRPGAEFLMGMEALRDIGVPLSVRTPIVGAYNFVNPGRTTRIFAANYLRGGAQIALNAVQQAGRAVAPTLRGAVQVIGGVLRNPATAIIYAAHDAANAYAENIEARRFSSNVQRRIREEQFEAAVGDLVRIQPQGMMDVGRPIDPIRSLDAVTGLFAIPGNMIGNAIARETPNRQDLSASEYNPLAQAGQLPLEEDVRRNQIFAVQAARQQYRLLDSVSAGIVGGIGGAALALAQPEEEPYVTPIYPAIEPVAEANDNPLSPTAPVIRVRGPRRRTGSVGQGGVFTPRQAPARPTGNNPLASINDARPVGQRRVLLSARPVARACGC